MKEEEINGPVELRNDDFISEDENEIDVCGTTMFLLHSSLEIFFFFI